MEVLGSGLRFLTGLAFWQEMVPVGVYRGSVIMFVVFSHPHFFPHPRLLVPIFRPDC